VHRLRIGKNDLVKFANFSEVLKFANFTKCVKICRMGMAFQWYTVLLWTRLLIIHNIIHMLIKV